MTTVRAASSDDRSHDRSPQLWMSHHAGVLTGGVAGSAILGGVLAHDGPGSGDRPGTYGVFAGTRRLRRGPAVRSWYGDPAIRCRAGQPAHPGGDSGAGARHLIQAAVTAAAPNAAVLTVGAQVDCAHAASMLAVAAASRPLRRAGLGDGLIATVLAVAGLAVAGMAGAWPRRHADGAPHRVHGARARAPTAPLAVYAGRGACAGGRWFRPGQRRSSTRSQTWLTTQSPWPPRVLSDGGRGRPADR